jgi:hypothetical protein
MREFKFLSGEKSIFGLYSREINPNNYRTISLTGNIRFLREYYRRLDCIYTSHYNMYDRDNPLFNDALELYNRTVRFIEQGQLTTHEEIRRFVHSTYSDLVYGFFDRYEIDDTRNQEMLVETYNFLNPRR